MPDHPAFPDMCLALCVHVRIRGAAAPGWSRPVLPLVAYQGLHADDNLDDDVIHVVVVEAAVVDAIHVVVV